MYLIRCLFLHFLGDSIQSLSEYSNQISDHILAPNWQLLDDGFDFRAMRAREVSLEAISLWTWGIYRVQFEVTTTPHSASDRFSCGRRFPKPYACQRL